MKQQLLKARFEDLPEKQKEIARHIFFDASSGDGYLYKDHTDYCRDPEGNVMCRTFVGNRLESRDFI